MPHRLRLATLFVCLLPLFAGCGGSGANPSGGGAVVSGAASPIASPAQTTFRFGTVKLAGPVANAAVTVQRVDGSQITTASNAAGTFVVRDPLTEGRVVVRAPGVTLSLEVANGSPSWLWVSGVTTLVSRYVQKHPGVSIADATARVRAYLDIPASVDIGSGLGDTERSSFSWSQFVHAAGATPLDAFIDQQVAAIDSGGRATFRKPDPYAAIHAALAAGTLVTPPRNKRANAFLSSDGFTLGGVGAGVAGNTITGVVAGSIFKTLSYITEKSAYATIGQDLDQIQSSLDTIQQELVTMTSDITSLTNQVTVLGANATNNTNIGVFQTQVAALDGPVSRIESMTRQYFEMLTALIAQGAANTANTPVFAPPSAVTTFANNLILYNTGSNTLASDIQTLRNVLQGQSQQESLLLLNASVSVFSQYAALTSGAHMFADVRSNALNANLQKRLDFYRIIQLLAANLAGEYAHLDQTTFALPNSPTSNALPTTLTNARLTIDAIANDMAIEQQMTPLPTIGAAVEDPSRDGVDDVFVDLTTNTMWYTVVQPFEVVNSEDPFSAIYQAARSFSLGPWGAGEWRLASVDELTRLYQLANTTSPNAPNFGLPKMGFTAVPQGDLVTDAFIASTVTSSTYSGPVVTLVGVDWSDGVENPQGTLPGAGQVAVAFFVRKCPGAAGSNPNLVASPPTQTGENPGTLLAVGYPQSMSVATRSDGLTSNASFDTSIGIYDLLPGQSRTLDLLFGTFVPVGQASYVVTLGYGNLVNWTVPSGANFGVSNIAGIQGSVIYHGPSPTGGTVFANLLTSASAGFSPNPPLQGAFPTTSLPGTASTPALTSILVTPQNRALQSPNTSQTCYATGYFSDGTQRDLTQSVNWSVSTPQPVGSSPPTTSTARIDVGVDTVVILPTPPGVYNYTVTATDPSSGLSGTATFQGEY